MSFASPFMLLGVLALGPLIWLHLKKNKQQVIGFPTIFLLRRVMKQQEKQLKLKQWILLAVRALLVIAISIALARPSLTVWRPGGVRSGLPIAQVILLDNSASMQRVLNKDKHGTTGTDATDDSNNNDSTAFARAQKMAVAEIGRLRPQDAVAIILTGKPPKLLTNGLTTDKEPTALRIDTLSAGMAADTIDDAILKAEQLLDKSTYAQKEILLITDLAAAPIQNDTLKNMRSTLRVQGIGPDQSEHANCAVQQVEIFPTGKNKAREVVIKATIANFGSAQKKVTVALSLNGKPAAKGTVLVRSKQTAVKEFQHRFDNKGTHFGVVKIDDDLFGADNARYFATNVRRSINVLVINGDSRPGSYLDEVFYLQKALETPIPDEVPIQTHIIEPEVAKVTPFESYDVVFLAGVSTLSSGLEERLTTYVEAGGGLFISASGQHKPLTKLQAVMPAHPDGARKRDPERAFLVGAVEFAHPIFQTVDAQSTGMETVVVNGHWLLKPNPTVERNVLVQLTDGVPLLLERTVAKGTVLLLTTTLDRDWTDLPIRPGYLPLIQRSTRYLSRSLEHREPRSVEVGTPVPLAVTEGMQKLIVSTPQKNRTVYSAARLADKTRIWFHNTAAPGPYRIWAEMPGFGGLTELSSAAFVSNVAASESDLSKKMKQSGEISKDDKDMYTALKGKLPIWSYLLLFAVLLMLLEAFVVGYGLRKSHLKKTQ